MLITVTRDKHFITATKQNITDQCVLAILIDKIIQYETCITVFVKFRRHFVILELYSLLSYYKHR